MVLIDTVSGSVLKIGKHVNENLANFLASKKPSQYKLGEEKATEKAKEEPAEELPETPEVSISEPVAPPKKRGRRPTKKS